MIMNLDINQQNVVIFYFLSSLSKTNLRMSIGQGIMDSGYRGEFIVVVDNISEKDFEIKQGEKIVSIM